MKKVLWISRHEMTKEQRADLEQVLGDSVTLLQASDTVQEISSLLPMLAQADAVAAVLPPALLAELWRLAGEKPVLQSVSARIRTGALIRLNDGRTEPEFAFAHVRWQQILRFDFAVKDFPAAASRGEKNSSE